jgi:hypothetical protein
MGDDDRPSVSIPPMKPPMSLEQIRQDVRSDRQEVRGHAMQTLYQWAKRDESLRPAALEIFRDSLAGVEDGWTATQIARGIELIGGPAEGREAWPALLDHRSSSVDDRRLAKSPHHAGFGTPALSLSKGSNDDPDSFECRRAPT